MIPLDLLMFAALIGCILLGFPVSFSISGVAVIFAFLGWAFGVMDISLLGALGQRLYNIVINEVLIAIPLFIFMGIILERGKLAEELLETMGRLFGRLRGGLGISVVLVGALLAASTGIVGATVIAMGLIALPTMLRNGYSPKLASGIVCTAGTLGQIIPPSTLLIILAEVMSNAYQQAQYTEGKFAVEAISVGQIFAGAVLPGLTMVAVYMTYILIRAWLIPSDAPPVREAGGSVSRKEVMGAVIPPVILIIAVLGAILGGVASPTEAASVGAVGALLLVALRMDGRKGLILAGAIALMLLGVAAGLAPARLQRNDVSPTEVALGIFYIALAVLGITAIAWALIKAQRKGILIPTMTRTLTVTSMIFATIIMASAFSLVFVGLHGEERIQQILAFIPGGPTGALIFCMALIFVLGFFLDFVEITVILLPLVVPPLILMGHDPFWLTILIAINLQTSFLTPPFGFSLFYLRGAAPPEVTTGHIYQGVLPFIGLQIVAMALIWLVPGIATWLPKTLF